MKENSIEEDIIILEELRIAKENCSKNAKIKDNPFVAIWEKQNRAIEHILSNYKRVLKENEHKTKKIENQKAELAILNEKQKDFNKLQNTLSSYEGQFRRQEKENEKLRKRLNEENKRCMMLAIEKQDYFEKYRYNLQQNENLTKEFSNVIPIQKVKDKIEELNKAYEDSKDENGESEYYYPDYTIRVLEELLEKRK